MGRKFNKQCNDYINGILAEVQEEAYARARYRAQVDFNTEMIDEIADRTGHKNLANTCFAEVSIESKKRLEIDYYTDDSLIEGIHRSNSSFHKSGGRWKSVTKHYGMSREDFWENKFSGEDNGEYGTVDADWLTDNFWYGTYYATNGWPRSQHNEFLQVYKYHDLSAEQICKEYTARYKSERRFDRYVREELNLISK